MRLRTGNGYEALVRDLAFHIPGHDLRRVSALRERVLPVLASAAAE
jgi:hypothetical protein